MTLASGFVARMREVIAALAEGDVASYGEIAALAGRPEAPRAVGMVLAGSEGLPWWRVVTARGRLVPGQEAEQARRLRREGVPVQRGRVVGFHRPASLGAPR